jgi:hypothetical protein
MRKAHAPSVLASKQLHFESGMSRSLRSSTPKKDSSSSQASGLFNYIKGLAGFTDELGVGNSINDDVELEGN